MKGGFWEGFRVSNWEFSIIFYLLRSIESGIGFDSLTDLVKKRGFLRMEIA